MLEEILTQAMSYIQLIIAALLLLGVVLQLIHIGQTRRINKKLNYAGMKLQQYLNVVFTEEEEEEEQKEDKPVQAVQAEVIQSRKSRQEEDMRVSLEHKKQQKDGELMDTVLQEIFD